jgi:Uma2 family endonuclease
VQERRAPFRSEYYRGELFAKAGVNFVHNLIKVNLASEAGNQLKDGPCRVVTSDMRVKVDASGLYTHPDIVVVFDEPQFEDAVFDTLLNPQVIVEILSESTEKYDRGTKFEQDRKIPSLREYILVAQDRMYLERHVRQPDDSWLLTEFSGTAPAFEFVTISVRVPMTEIYRGVDFPAAPVA